MNHAGTYGPAPPSRMRAMKKVWCKRRRGVDAVSPVIATILLVGITVVLAATLYVMVFGFGLGSSNTPPVASFTKTSITNGFKFTFTSFSMDTVWGDIYIVLSDGTNSVSFDNITTESLTTGVTVLKSFGSRTLDSLTVFINVTDLAGNGYVNQGDSFTLTTSGGVFSNAVPYEAFLMHGPTSSKIFSMPFLGD